MSSSQQHDKHHSRKGTDNVDLDDSFSEIAERDQHRPHRTANNNSFWDDRDRRKQCDTTTPTLIDEDFEKEEEEIAAAAATQARGGRTTNTPNAAAGTQGIHGDDTAHRRTPGASMYKSPFSASTQPPTQQQQQQQQQQHHSEETTDLRATSTNTADKETLGFGLMLSTPVSDEYTRQRIWSSSFSTATPSPSMEQETVTSGGLPPRQSNRTPVGRTPPAQTDTNKEPYSSSSLFSWANDKEKDMQQTDGSNRAYSPNILRLTEDIGNLLHDDEDDAFALEINDVLKPKDTKRQTQTVAENWSGAYMFGPDYRGARQPAVRFPDPPPEQVRARDRAASSPFAHAHYPEPRRIDKRFEFGKQRDERASPQLLNFNFGGAFGPPLNQAGAFMRPVASAPGTASQPSAPHGAAPTFTVHQAQSFDSYQPRMPPHGQGPPGIPMQSYRSQTPTEIQRSRQEPVLYAPPPMQWRGPPQAPSPTSMIEHPPHWQSSAYSVDTNYNFRRQQYRPPQQVPDHRLVTTPSPHMSAWHAAESPTLYGVTPPPAIFEPSYMQPSPTTVNKATTKRGKRGKKKSKPDKSETGKQRGSRREETPTRPGSAVSQGEDTVQSEDRNSGATKRAELVESPSTRAAFKIFYKEFRSEEKVSYQKAEKKAIEALGDSSLPESVHWRVYLELAELAKRSNRFSEARRLYQKVCQLQPYASQGWLEYSKLEEECGHMNRVTNILHIGLEHCKYAENLLTKAVRHQERIGNVKAARELLARLKHVGIEKVWKTVLEGALLEARAGNYTLARKVLKYLMHHVPWYGPLYLEAFKLEHDLGHTLDALEVVERGLQENSKYGPLWFGGFLLCEEMDLAAGMYDMPKTSMMFDRAVRCISKELTWKVHLQAAQIYERAAIIQSERANIPINMLLGPARFRCAMTSLTCPQNLRWKVLALAARLELGAGNIETAKAIYLKAHRIVPDKGKPWTLIELARLEEFRGETEISRAILCRGRQEHGHDWKVWLESALFEIRDDKPEEALELSSKALRINPVTGRLWSLRIQLSQACEGASSQQEALRQALNVVPKSGEVWCEGARIHMNPYSDMFDLSRARRYLHFATVFTPQYGDSFIELARLEILARWLAPTAKTLYKKTVDMVNRSEDGRILDLPSYLADVMVSILAAMSLLFELETSPRIIFRDVVSSLRKKLSRDNLASVGQAIDLNALRLSCANADPNYGTLWFNSRRSQRESPRKVIEDATQRVADEILKHAHLYLIAMVRRLAIAGEDSLDIAGESFDPSNMDQIYYDDKDKEIMNAPSIERALEKVAMKPRIKGERSSFVTGLMGLRSHRSAQAMALDERKRALFGTDALFP